MSLTRSVYQELCDFVQNKPSAVLGHKFFDVRVVLQSEVAQKSDRFESRLFVISKFRVFLLHGKTPGSLKIDRSFHILTIKALHVVKEDELSLSIDEAGSRRKLAFRGNPALQVAIHLLSAIKHYFPDISPVLRNLLDVQPSSLLHSFDSIRIEVSPRACHSFRRTYAALCDYFDQPYREEVSWDIEKIYTVNQILDLRIEDFSHLLPKDLLPIVGVLQYSSYFTGLSVDGLKLPPDLVDVILCVVRRSHWLTHLRLVNCGLPKDFITLFSSAVQQNPNLPLEVFDFSKNQFDDKKGFQSLSACLPRLSTLREVHLSESALTDKCCSLLASALYGSLSPNRSASSMQLTHLSLAKNHLNGDASSLISLVSLCNSLRILDLTDTQLPLDKLWPALKYGGLQLEKLLLGGCTVGSKKTVLECVQPVKEFFSMAVNLNEIDLSNTVLPAEVLKAMLLGLACNQQLSPFALCLNSSLERGGASVLEACLHSIRARSLSLRDNHIEMDLLGVVSALAGMPALRRIDLGGANMVQLRRSGKQQHAQHLNKILLELVKLIGDEGRLEELVLSEARLGAHLTMLLNTLGATSCLKYLDISSNEMGNFGARILSKALQLNVSLRTLHIDGNHISSDGFVDIATAMNMNSTLVTLPYPVQDASEALLGSGRSRVLSALTQIEASLERNRAIVAPEQANFKRAIFTLHQVSDGMAFESSRTADALLRGARSLDEPLPLRLQATVEGFANQICSQMGEHVRNSLSHCEGDMQVGETVDRVGKVATDRLKESMLRDVAMVLSEWKWRAACETAEGVLRVGGTSTGTGSVGGVSGGGSPGSAVASPRTHHRNDAAHRPRSMVGELTSPNEEGGVSLDTPPKPSVLVHLAKGRPRPQRRGAPLVKERSASTPSDDMSRSVCDVVCETDEDDRSDETPRKSLSGRPVFRAAMLPEASLISAAQLRPANDRTPGSPKLPERNEHRTDAVRARPLSPEESPPPLPRRQKILDGSSSPTTPPQLPPKPDSRFAFGAISGRGDGASGIRAGAALPCVPPPQDPPVDDENANNRRSVADMARLFNR